MKGNVKKTSKKMKSKHKKKDVNNNSGEVDVSKTFQDMNKFFLDDLKETYSTKDKIKKNYENDLNVQHVDDKIPDDRNYIMFDYERVKEYMPIASYVFYMWYIPNNYNFNSLTLIRSNNDGKHKIAPFYDEIQENEIQTDFLYQHYDKFKATKTENSLGTFAFKVDIKFLVDELQNERFLPKKELKIDDFMIWEQIFNDKDLFEKISIYPEILQWYRRIQNLTIIDEAIEFFLNRSDVFEFEAEKKYGYGSWIKKFNDSTKQWTYSRMVDLEYTGVKSHFSHFENTPIPPVALVVVFGQNSCGKTRCLNNLRHKNYERNNYVERENNEENHEENNDNKDVVDVAADGELDVDFKEVNPEDFGKLSEYFFRIFGEHLAQDTTNNCYRITQTNVSNEEKTLESHQKFLESCKKLNNEGTGKRNCGKILHYLFSGKNVIALDEPDKFLHPPQASLLGKLISEICAEKELQVFVATHNIHFLRECIFSHKDIVYPIYLERSGDKETTFKNLRLEIPGILENATNHDLNGLIGFFHDKYIMVEGPTDEYFYSQVYSLIKGTNSDFDGFDACFAQFGGKSMIFKKLREVRCLGINAAIVVDFDFLRKKDLEQFMNSELRLSNEQRNTINRWIDRTINKTYDVENFKEKLDSAFSKFKTHLKKIQENMDEQLPGSHERFCSQISRDFEEIENSWKSFVDPDKWESISDLPAMITKLDSSKPLVGEIQAIFENNHFKVPTKNLMELYQYMTTCESLDLVIILLHLSSGANLEQLQLCFEKVLEKYSEFCEGFEDLKDSKEPEILKTALKCIFEKILEDQHRQQFKNCNQIFKILEEIDSEKSEKIQIKFQLKQQSKSVFEKKCNAYFEKLPNDHPPNLDVVLSFLPKLNDAEVNDILIRAPDLADDVKKTRQFLIQKHDDLSKKNAEKSKKTGETLREIFLTKKKLIDYIYHSEKQINLETISTEIATNLKKLKFPNAKYFDDQSKQNESQPKSKDIFKIGLDKNFPDELKGLAEKVILILEKYDVFVVKYGAVENLMPKIWEPFKGKKADNMKHVGTLKLYSEDKSDKKEYSSPEAEELITKILNTKKSLNYKTNVNQLHQDRSNCIQQINKLEGEKLAEVQKFLDNLQKNEII